MFAEIKAATARASGTLIADAAGMVALAVMLVVGLALPGLI
ncbi:hypothetical protein [Acidimangrovimonas pyrenivorans]|uniref:Uncharacterized protein n=1 Tax=Acidimangrovimonas pyrenivorans TaxID=2030798 RepID=A0ABV7AFJ7_9RHOB